MMILLLYRLIFAIFRVVCIKKMAVKERQPETGDEPFQKRDAEAWHLEHFLKKRVVRQAVFVRFDLFLAHRSIRAFSIVFLHYTLYPIENKGFLTTETKYCTKTKRVAVEIPPNLAGNMN